MSEPIQVTLQPTPNPNAIKFTLNRTVSTEGKTFRPEEPVEVAWAKDVLEIPGITQLFTINNFISVTKEDAVQWNDVAPKVEQILTKAFA